MTNLSRLVERWRAARAAMISMPFGDPDGRTRLNELSEAEHSLFAEAGGMEGPPFDPGSDSAAICRCPLCVRAFDNVPALISHLKSKHQ